MRLLISTSFLYFAAAKSIVFLMPLAYRFVHGPSVYVKVEAAIASALLLVPLLGMGLTSTYVQFEIKDPDKSIRCVYPVHLLFMQAIIFIVMAIAPGEYSEILVICSLILTSLFNSIKAKVDGRIKSAFFYDAFTYMVLLVPLLWGGSWNVWPVDYGLMVFAALYLFWTFSVMIRKAPSVREISIARILRFYGFGGLAMLSGWLSVAVILVPRQAAEDVLSVAFADRFYLAIRCASVIVLLYQFYAISYFRKLYTFPVRRIFKIVSRLYLTVLSMVIVMALFFESLSISFSEIYIFSIYFAGAWVCISLCEAIVLREYVFRRIVIPLGILVGSYSMWVHTGDVDNAEFLFVSGVLVTMYVLVQVLGLNGSLRKRFLAD